MQFEGRQVLLFVRLAANGGKAKITIDGAAEEIIDTYSADDIWGVGIYHRVLPAPSGPHTLRLEVLGEHGPCAKGDLIHLDGVRIEPE